MMRDQLIRYLMDELDAQERRVVEDELARSDELRRELAYLRSCLCPEDDADTARTSEPPRGLAERTTDLVTVGECGPLVPSRLSACALASYDVPSGIPSWSLADLTVAGGVFLAISMLFLPALRESRDAARRTQCANNLNELGTKIVRYADLVPHRGYFPLVGRNDTAGVFAIYLLQEDLATKAEMARLLVCRSSPVGEQVAARALVLRFPDTVAELRNLEDFEREAVLAQIGGSYAYGIGYVTVTKDRYHGILNDRSCRKAMLADAPTNLSGGVQLLNHSGGQNVWFQDGSVRFVSTCMLPGFNDHLFLNEEQKAAAGCSSDDTVLGGSNTPPGEVPWTTVPPGDGN